MYTGGGLHPCGSALGWDWNVHKSRASERAAFAYIMSDGVLFLHISAAFGGI